MLGNSACVLSSADLKKKKNEISFRIKHQGVKHFDLDLNCLHMFSADIIKGNREGK